MPKISTLYAQQILDSRGNPTVEVDCFLDDGSFGRAAVPSGASMSTYEALELRDGDMSVYTGKAVTKAVANVNEDLQAALNGMSTANQREVDREMLLLDGTDHKSRLGANAILGVSMAVCRARAMSEQKPLYRSLADQFSVKDVTLLPVPLMSVINGGAHADGELAFQECMIVPTGFSSFSEALRASTETFHALKTLLKNAGHIITVGDEGGFVPHMKDANEAFSFLTEAICTAGYEGKMQLAIDAAASKFSKEGVYQIDGRRMNSAELAAYYGMLCQKYPIVSIEDSHAEDDWEGFQIMVQTLGSRIQLVGDDLLVTDVARIREALEKKAANAVLMKVNQIGTISETVDAIQLAQKNGWRAVASHCRGETEDTFIAHLAVGLGTGQIKTGSPSRSDRICKYNELLRIEEELGSAARYVSPF